MSHIRGSWRSALSPAERRCVPSSASGRRDRYFSDALPAPSTALYPATIAHGATMAVTHQALARGDLSEAVRSVLTEQRELLRRVIDGRTTATGATAGPGQLKIS